MASVRKQGAFEVNRDRVAVRLLFAFCFWLPLFVPGVAGHGAGDADAPSLMVSFDGGTTWHTAHLTGTNGNYTATWPNAAPGPSVYSTLKVTATDSVGNTITQTITHAYTLASRPDSGQATP